MRATLIDTHNSNHYNLMEGVDKKKKANDQQEISSSNLISHEKMSDKEEGWSGEGRGLKMVVVRQEMKRLSWVWDLMRLQANLPQTQLVTTITNSIGPQHH
ncbi:unnamed protein product [Dovyalis caffra]|uniref:Uncharacterized protein n=1 Tax=Dovyalis caffra TaxID=77055 RepID=A0AAV1S0Y3_9ROSI|nr:unnamed protein product [Dovyalis caffra]